MTAFVVGSIPMYLKTYLKISTASRKIVILYWYGLLYSVYSNLHNLLSAVVKFAPTKYFKHNMFMFLSLLRYFVYI